MNVLLPINYVKVVANEKSYSIQVENLGVVIPDGIKYSELCESIVGGKVAGAWSQLPAC